MGTQIIGMSEHKESLNFIEEIIEEDLRNGKHDGRIHTRFPPEPNGYLHIGHTKAIWVNFGLAEKYGGVTNLRFDDTNPTTEETEYVDNIKKDIAWLGYKWDEREYYTSDYFQTLYDYAVTLIKKDLAFVDDSTADEIAEQKGVPSKPGKESPYKTRSIEENLKLFEGMKNGEFEDGSKVLRVKVDMTSPNMHMRDPVIYRIKKETHHRTGDEWCIYPMYDFAHGQSDSVEKITHSLCSLEFIHHRPLYNWFIEKLEIFPSRQIEFARMNVSYMITSKRKLLRLVEGGMVDGWNDPRMPTISGLRRRGYTPKSIRDFCAATGLAKRDNVIEVELLESILRNELNQDAQRVHVVLNPVPLVITNYPEGKVEMMVAKINPMDEDSPTREIPFSGRLLIERDDFMEEDPGKKYYRMAPGRNVRLKNGYILNCTGCTKDADGNITEVQATYYEDSRSGSDTSGVKPKGTMHYVSEQHAIEAQVNLYDRLFTDPTPTSHENKDYLEFVNPDSLKVIEKAYCEPYLVNAKQDDKFQFIRLGYFTPDYDSTAERLIFNRTVSLKDKWKKKNK